MAHLVNRNCAQTFLEALPLGLQIKIRNRETLYPFFEARVPVTLSVQQRGDEFLLLFKAISCRSGALQDGKLLKETGLVPLFLRILLQHPYARNQSQWQGLSDEEHTEIIHLARPFLEGLSGEPWPMECWCIEFLNIIAKIPRCERAEVLAMALPFMGGVATGGVRHHMLEALAQVPLEMREQIITLRTSILQHFPPMQAHYPAVIGAIVKSKIGDICEFEHAVALAAKIKTAASQEGDDVARFCSIVAIASCERDQVVELALQVLARVSFGKRHLVILDEIAVIVQHERQQVVELAMPFIEYMAEADACRDLLRAIGKIAPHEQRLVVELAMPFVRSGPDKSDCCFDLFLTLIEILPDERRLASIEIALLWFMEIRRTQLAGLDGVCVDVVMNTFTSSQVSTPANQRNLLRALSLALPLEEYTEMIGLMRPLLEGVSDAMSWCVQCLNIIAKIPRCKRAQVLAMVLPFMEGVAQGDVRYDRLAALVNVPPDMREQIIMLREPIFKHFPPSHSDYREVIWAIVKSKIGDIDEFERAVALAAQLKTDDVQEVGDVARFCAVAAIALCQREQVVKLAMRVCAELPLGMRDPPVITHAIATILPHEQDPVVECAMPCIKYMADVHDYRHLLREVVEMPPHERKLVVELALPFIRHRPRASDVSKIFRALSKILPDEHRQEAIEIALLFMEGEEGRLAAEWSHGGYDIPSGCVAVGMNMLQRFQVANPAKKRALVLTLSLSLQMMNGGVDAQQRMVIFCFIENVIKRIEESNREYDVAVVMPIVLSIPNIFKFKVSDIDTLRNLARILVQHGDSRGQISYSRDQIRDVMQCMVQALLRDTAPVSPKMLITLERVLSTLTHLGAARYFAQFIEGWGEEILWHTEDDSLIRRAIDVRICTEDEDLRDPLNPYTLYAHLRAAAPLSCIARQVEVGRQCVRWNYAELQRKARRRPIVASDLPAGNPAEIFDDLMRHFLQQDAALLEAELREVLLTRSQVEGFVDAYIQTLMDTYPAPDTVVLDDVLQWRCILQFLSSCDARERVDSISERSLAFLKAVGSIAGCKTGRQEGLAIYYSTLHRDDDVLQELSPGLLPHVACIHKLLQKSYQTQLHAHLSGDNPLMRELTHTPAASLDVNELASQARYVKNLIGTFVGLAQPVIFEPHTQCISPELFVRSPEEVFHSVESQLTPLWFAETVRTEINRLIPHQPIISNGIGELIGNADAYWEGDYGYDAPPLLSIDGVCQLLIKVGYFTT